MLIVSVPCLLLWTFGIPAFALYLLMREKKHIDRITSKTEEERSEEDKVTLHEIRTKFGFLFMGYDLRVMYWEVVIMLRKIILIMTCVFLSLLSSETQVLVSLFILIIFLLLHIKF